MKGSFSKTKLILGIFLFFLGILTSCFIINQENRQNKNNTVVEATVTSCIMTYEEYDYVDATYDRVYSIGVKYNYNGKNYESSIDYSSKKSVGKKIKIHIDPDDPTKTDGMYGGLTDYIAPITFIGIPLTVGGALLAISEFKSRKNESQSL